MSLKIDFVERAEKGEKIARLCQEFGISRTTGHKWLNRFRKLGYEGLEEESRRPKSTPLATAEEMVLSVLQARDAHPHWGPEKLQILLRRRYGEQTPSARTIARILSRASRVRSRRKRRAPSVIERAPQAHALAPNDVWTVDFKGWWRARDGQRCEPLTVRDAFSRYVLTITLCSTKTQETRAVFERLFRRFGVPGAIQCDNGIPFVSVRSRGGLSALSAWWLSLGIRLVRSRPGCPQDNGAHERMHRDVSSQLQLNPASDRASQQRMLDRWRQEFNSIRPHQALEGKTPVQLYRTAVKRPMRSCIFFYPPHLHLARVAKNGLVSFQGNQYFLSESLAGHDVALGRIDPFHARVWFRDLDLGLIDVTPDIDDLLFENSNSLQKPRPAA